ncbi:MAG: hypothetical protein KJ621_20890 [Proteobacteria bacterium]|nr:hypothetical protein [Pseudomonadota bacterium]MBU1740186.1 hypothetical protein [Pseudomonadota bacterium]
MRSIRVCVIILAVLSMAVVVRSAPDKPRAPHAAWVVPSSAADPMFTPLERGACPARAVKKNSQCLWCPPDYHGHVKIKGTWLCYRCRAKTKADLKGVGVISAQGRLWCVKCRPGYRWGGRGCVK